MSTRRAGRVVVATSGSAASRSAITYATREAVGRGLPLEIVHVIPSTMPVGPYGGAPDAVVRRSGRELLDLGEQLARRTDSHVLVVTTLLTGSRVDALVHHSEGADLLVVGAPPHDLLERLWTGSTVTGTAARARCPVAIVPPRPDDAPPPTPTRTVVVGLKSTRRAGYLLSTAFAVAAQQQAELRVVHAWHLTSPYDEAVAGRVPTPDWETEEGRSIEGQLIDLRMAYPEVQVDVELVHGQAAYTLVAASHEADVVLISRPAHGGFVHYLGATARAVIREAACPVLVVPPLDETKGVEHARTESAMAP
jgi:nucleotide-binding universal stress UspA family protein